LAQESQQKTQRGTAISGVDWMGLGAPAARQMTAHEPLHKRLANFMHGQAMLAQPTRKMFSDLHIALEARQNMPARLKKQGKVR
jgi:hypothetical protein